MVNGRDELDRVCSALWSLNAGCSNSEWVSLGMSFKSAGGDFATFNEWSATGANYGGEKATLVRWKSWRVDGGIRPATLFRAAIDAGWSDSSPVRRPAPSPVRRPDPERGLPETLDPRRLRYWRSLGPVSDVGRAYLEARQCAIPPTDGDLRFDPAGRHPNGHEGPCLVAMVTDILTCAPISLHRTWIKADGTKADVDPPRLLLGGHRKAGGVIRLWPDEALTQGLAIAEGIETALSLARVFRPAWALIDAGNLATLPALAGVDALTIAVDDDFAGVTAANTCAERWALSDRDVTLVEVNHGA